MNKKDPTEVLNNHMKYLIDYLKSEIRILGRMNGLSDSQISDMERDFIARLAFAAIIGDDEKKDECEDCSAKDCCALKKHDKSEGIPSDVINALLYVKHHICEGHDCDECPFGSSGGVFCRLNDFPSCWEV